MRFSKWRSLGAWVLGVRTGSASLHHRDPGRSVSVGRHNITARGGELLHLKHLISQLPKGVLPGHPLELGGSVLVDELVNGEVATTHAHVDVVVIHADVDALCPIDVDALTLTLEHDPESLSVSHVVDIVSDSLINEVTLHGDVESELLFQLYVLSQGELDIQLELLNLSLGLL